MAAGNSLIIQHCPFPQFPIVRFSGFLFPDDTYFFLCVCCHGNTFASSATLPDFLGRAKTVVFEIMAAGNDPLFIALRFMTL